MTIGVIGSGTMGIGIVQIVVSKGYKVFLYDSKKEQLEIGLSFLNKMLSRQVEKGKLTSEQKEQTIGLVSLVEDIQKLEKCQLIIEAIIEDIQIKQKIFFELEQIVDRSCVLASNTSSLSISSIAGCSKYPERFLGVHFFNPAPLMPLVEIIPTILTHSKVVRDIKNLMLKWKKTPVLAKDTPGFIVNRIARPFYGESFRIYEEGIADFITIDWALKTFGNFRMGPFELTDLIGQDINNAVSEIVFKNMYFDSRYKPSIIQKRMVEMKLLGRKTGRGFYSYEGKEKQDLESKQDEELGKQIFDRVLVMLINEAVDALYLKIASKEDIDMAMTKGVNYPKGLLRWCDEIGAKKVLSILQSLYQTYQEDRYRPSVLLKKLAANNEKIFDE